MSDLRSKVIGATVDLIAKQGVREISFREVARLAGVSHQTPYHLFQDYRGILRAIAQEGFGELCRSMQSASAKFAKDPMDALEASGVAYATFAVQNPGHFRVMFQSALVDIHDPKAPLQEAAETHQTLVRLATEAHAAGYGKHMAVETMTLLCWSTVHGIAVFLVEGILSRKSAAHPGTAAELTQKVVGALSDLFRECRVD